MAYIVGATGNKSKDTLNLLGQPGSFQNIKAQLQQQASPPSGPAFQSPRGAVRPEDEAKKKQRFQDGDIVEDEFEEEEGAAPSLTGTTAAITPGATGATGPSAPPTGVAQKSGAFTNLQRYAEENIPKVEQVGQAIVGGLEKEAGEVRSGLGKTQERFLGEEGIYRPDTQSFITKQISEAGTAPDVGRDVERFKQLKEGYETPTFAAERKTAEDLERRSQQFRTPEGRFTEIQKTLGTKAPGYSAGQRSLDQALLTRNRAMKAALVKGVRGATKGLTQEVGGLQKQIGEQRLGAMQQSRRELEEARTGLSGELQSRYERLRGGLTAGTLSQEDLSRLGLQAGQRTYGAQLEGGLETTRGMTAPEQARLDALARLAGQEGRTTFAGIEGGDVAPKLQEMIQQRKGSMERELAANESDPEYQKLSSAYLYWSNASARDPNNSVLRARRDEMKRQFEAVDKRAEILSRYTGTVGKYEGSGVIS